MALLRLGVRYGIAGLSTDRVNRRLLATAASDPAQLIERLVQLRRTPRRLFDRIAPDTQLAEFVVHQQDIRRPLGIARDIPVGRLRRALDALDRLPGLGAKRRAQGLRWEATDLPWSRGKGPVVQGPAEVLLMTLAGRPHAIGELDGSGVPALDRRLRRSS